MPPHLGQPEFGAGDTLGAVRYQPSERAGKRSSGGFLLSARSLFPGQLATDHWDGLPSHRSRLMTDFLAKQAHWLEVRRLPAYAPELNPVEGLWSNLKARELANRCDTMVRTLAFVARQGVDRVRGDRSLPFSFLHHAGLQL